MKKLTRSKYQNILEEKVGPHQKKYLSDFRTDTYDNWQRGQQQNTME